MAFNTLEYLKDGKVDFVYNLTPYDYAHLIINIRKAPNRIEIINGFLSKLEKTIPHFCFDVIYDIPQYANIAYKLMDIKRINPEKLSNVLYNSPLGIKILYENLDTFLYDNDFKMNFDVIVKYAFDSNNRDLIYKLSRYKNLHIRFLFMEYIIENKFEEIDIIYDDITKYTTSFTYEQYEQLTFLPELMKSEDISKLAVLLLSNNREKDYLKLKKIILEKYKYNHLASELLEYKTYIDSSTNKLIEDPNNQKRKNAFLEDADTLFKTSSNYCFTIYLKHKENISENLLEEFSSRIKYYIRDDQKNIWASFRNDNEPKYDLELRNIYSWDLGHLLEDWTEKYMDLSKSKEYGFIGEGTTCSCFRIGDYVIKLVKAKWSYEDIICPNIYLVAKNYEEIYLRKNNGVVITGIEVQKYLTRSAKDIDPKYFGYFDSALNRLGYKRTDTLVNGTCGDNTMLLDTYRDADCDNPKKLPVWFKGCPLVLIDRDRIYPKDKTFIKQLRSSSY